MRTKTHPGARTGRVFLHALVGVAVLLGGCVPRLPGGGAREPVIAVPDAYPSVATAGGEAQAQGSSTPTEGSQAEATSVVDYHAIFAGGELAALIDEALANNQELNIAVQDILIANNEVLARRGDYIPNLGVGANVGVEHVPEQTREGRSDQVAGTSPTLPYYAVGFYASWEVDIWRRLRNLRDAAVNRYLASIEGRNFLVTRLVAEIASSYYELMALDEQLEVVRTTIELQQHSVDVVHLQFEAAAATAVAVTRLEAELYRFKAQEYEIRQRIVETENRINFLVGRYPRPIARPSASFLDLPPPNVRAGMPGSLLENRPDIRQAALELEATRFDVRAARARFYPSLTLVAGAGYASTSARQLFTTPQSLLLQVLGSVAAPLLNRRGITAAYFTADAQQLRAVLAYERAILSGYVEVVNRMNLIENSTRSLELREQQVERLNQAIDLSQRLFEAARADYLEVLTARRDALDAQLLLIETKRQQLSAAVGLYQALGGGWRTTSPSPSNANDGRNP